MPKTDLRDLTLEKLTAFVSDLGARPFRARQIFAWLYRPGITAFDQMTDLGKEFRVLLKERCNLSHLHQEVREVSRDGTVKFGFRLDDGLMIEAVLIPDGERNTLCVSSQVGCAMGCRFCLTGTMGFTRNLRPAEIVGQVTAAIDDLAVQGAGRLTNLVFMGMGEPLANLANLLDALAILQDPAGLDFAARRITVSTCGLVPGLAELGAASEVKLAISLHAANDATRSRLMPVNDTYPLARLLAACRAYPLGKRQRITMEYTLFEGINDADGDARELAKLLHGLRCKINLLSYNPCPALPFRSPPRARIEAFQAILQQRGYDAFIRESRGGDISAACGQLAGKDAATP